MNKPKLEIKLAFITGLREVVLNEISRSANFRVIKEEGDYIYLDFVQDLTAIKHLRSVSRAYVVTQNSKYSPFYIFNHKSIIGSLMEIIISGNEDKFKTFKITCAGSDSPRVRGIAEYIQRIYGLTEKEESDMKIHIIKKLDGTWEVGVQITSRPLFFRDYKVKNMSGAMDSTIAYAVNSLCELESVDSYLNIFSGSAALLIEAGQCYPNLEQLIGFDNNKKIFL